MITLRHKASPCNTNFLTSNKLLHIGQNTQHSVQDCHIYSDVKCLLCWNAKNSLTYVLWVYIDIRKGQLYSANNKPRGQIDQPAHYTMWCFLWTEVHQSMPHTLLCWLRDATIYCSHFPEDSRLYKREGAKESRHFTKDCETMAFWSELTLGEIC